jgi:O-succinylbenzoate synthase
MMDVMPDRAQSILRFDFRSYRRPFARPLKAAWGTWKIREGFFVRIENGLSGETGFGEVAPLSPFGTESLKQAAQFLASVPAEVDSHGVVSLLAEAPPACAFGLATALNSLHEDANPVPAVASAALLAPEQPIGPLRDTGYRCFKLKLGMEDKDREWRWIQDCILQLQPEERLRLDPNRGWRDDSWDFWKPRLNGISQYIDFIEEPFPFDRMPMARVLREAAHSPIPFALDESLDPHTLPQWIQRDWPGHYVIKPSLLGDPDRWLPLLKGIENRVVLSSAFETGIGLSALIRLAGAFTGREHGFGTGEFFQDTHGLSTAGNRLMPLSREEEVRIWEHWKRS